MKRCSKCDRFECTCEIATHKKYSDCYEESANNCPKKIKTPLFSSPNSGLPEEQLNELQHCIEEANNMLRTLGTQSNPENTRQLQLHLLKLQGLPVSVKIQFNFKETRERNIRKILENQTIDSIEEKKGVLGSTGRDFIQLNTKSGCIFILFERLVSINRLNNDQDHKQDAKERKINKELVFNFGEYVSTKPNLINLYFGIPLHTLLQNFMGKNVEVKTDKQIVSGTLVTVDETKLQIKIPSKSRNRKLTLKDICFLKFY